VKSPLFIPILLFAVGCATYRVPSGDRYALYMDGVTAEMTVPEFWLKSYPHPDKIIMTEVEIANMYGTPETDFVRFSKATKVDSAFIHSWAKVLGQRRSLYDNSGTPIDSCHWDAAITNMNINSVTGEILYAVTISNTEERILPTDERGYQDSDNAFFDDLVMTMMLANEPILVLNESLDGKWYLVLGKYAPAGWVHKDDIAICKNREDWQNTQTGDFLLITADRIRLDMDDPDGKDYRELTMGTKLKLISSDSIIAANGQRFAKNAYAVAFPERKVDGTLGYRTVFVPARDGVHVGYLPYTSRNILELAFASLGDRYGWGGTFAARDCSAYCQDIYRCFGILLPRNSSYQASYHGRTWNVEGMTTEQKYSTLKKHAIPGALLFMPGHVFMYLGGKYVINSASSFMLGDKKTYVQSVVINSLDEKRANGKTWIESMTNIKIYEKDN